MSGTFMDGGGHDHGGHHSGHGGDGGSFMDGGGHDHGHHHGHSHGHHGGDGGGFLNNLLGYNNHTGHHSFLSHLLGLDHDAHGGHGGDGGQGHQGGEMGGQAPSQSPIWSSALQGMKLSHAIEGITITQNVWFFLLFAAFIGWLFVVYWIRHHEPFADAVLGKGAANAQTVAADRRILDNCRDATPLRTFKTQAIYAPMPREFHDPAAAQASAAHAAMPLSDTQLGPSWMPPAMPPQASVLSSSPAPMPVPVTGMATYYNHSAPYGTPGIYTPQAIANPSGPGHLIATPMPQAMPGAQRLKMIINK